MRHKPISHIRDVPEQRSLGRAIRAQRAIRGLSQEELGFRSGLHRNYIGALERGEINPTFATFLRVGHGLRLSLSELMTAYEETEIAFRSGEVWPPVIRRYARRRGGKAVPASGGSAASVEVPSSSDLDGSGPEEEARA